MPAKLVLLHAKAREGILAGVNLLADAARVTLGPRGRNVMIQRSWGAPTVTKDGVTVVKEIDLEDKFENLGARMVREVAQKTSDVAGDGTTTATVLARAIFREGLRLLAAGFDAMELKRGIDAAVQKAVEALKAQAKPVKERERIAQVGTVSANGDAAIGELFAEAMDKGGQDGVITVEEAKGLDTTLEVVEGMRFDRGYLSPYFVTNPEKMTVELEEPVLLFFEKKISRMRDPRRHGQGQHHDRRRRGEEAGHPGPHQAAQDADRGDDVRLRSREAPGAAREARGRRRGHQGGRRHRGGDEGEEGARRGRHARHARGGRGGYRPGRRRGPAACADGAGGPRVRGRTRPGGGGGARRHGGAAPADRRQRRARARGRAGARARGQG